MLYWSKYIITDRIDGDLILWSTFYSKGIVVADYGNETALPKPGGMYNAEFDTNLTEMLVNRGMLLPIERLEREGKLVDKMRDEAVYDDTFMSLTIIPTDRCNFRCIYCYQSDTYHDMTDVVANSIIKMIKRNKTVKRLHVSWFGGEPLCNKPRVFSLMRELNDVCKEKGIVLIGDMTTNASLLDLDTFSELYALKVLNYQITIDGCKETHDIQRPLYDGKGSFDIILKNLRDIRDRFPGKFYKIGIRSNFTPLVDCRFDKMKEVLVNEFSNDKHFYFFFQWVKDWGGDRISSMTGELLGDAAAVEKYGRWMNVMSRTSVRTGDVSMIRTCSGLCVGCRKNSYLINTDGTICKCTVGLHSDEYRERSIIGYINESGNRVIDQWKEIDWIACDDELTNCKNCNMYPICLGMPCPYYKIVHGKAICNKDDSYVKYTIRSMAVQGYIERVDIR